VKILRSLYLDKSFFWALAVLAALFLTGYTFHLALAVAKVLMLAFAGAIMLDMMMIYHGKKTIFAMREVPLKFSNGDNNEIFIVVENHYPFTIRVNVIDEIPFQFQVRNFDMPLRLAPHVVQQQSYLLRPVERGEYHFGSLNVYVKGPVGFIRRRFIFEQGKTAPVYPSFIQLHKYELMAVSNRLTEAGIKRIRKIAHSAEFDHIKEYVTGDDQRSINWKATARRVHLMVNQYQDEKSQNVVSVIDKSRNMQMPFEGMTLLDHAINASLIISGVAIKKDDRAGLITFSDHIDSVVAPERKRAQMHDIMEVLYKEKNSFRESSYAALYGYLFRNLRHRSLVILFTNFSTSISLQRQLPYLKKIARQHLLAVVFFKNTELDALLEKDPVDTEGIYIRTVADQFMFEKKQMIRELNSYGIITIYTSPDALALNTVNKYLELKSRRMI
jgi:uncharacterized protein (DUF58 family)